MTTAFNNAPDDDESSEDEDFNFESNVGSRRYPVHDCCEFEDSESLRRLIFVRQDNSDSSSSTGSSSDDDSSSSSGDEDDTASAHAAAVGHAPVPNTAGLDGLKISDGAMNDPARAKQKKLPDSDERKQENSVNDNATEKSSENGTDLEKEPVDDKDVEEDFIPLNNVFDIKMGSPATTLLSSINVGTIVQSSEKAEEVKVATSVNPSTATVTPGGASLPAPMKIDSTEKVPKEPDQSPLTQKSTASRETTPVKPPKTKIKKERKKPNFYCPYDLDERDEDENTPIHVAVHARKIACVRLLLEAGAHANKKCDGSAPIHLAISMGAISSHESFAFECVKLLATHHADLAMKDDALHSPLYLACMGKLPQIAEWILSDDSGISTLNWRSDRVGGRALHACAKFDMPPKGSRNRVMTAPNESTLTRLLLSTPGIEIDPMNNYGRTPLHVASMYANWPAARLLLQQGANPNALDRRGLTPGNLASRRGMVVPNDLVPHLGDGAAMPIMGSSSESNAGVSRDLIMDPDASTIILCHEMCSKHRSCPPITRGSPDPPPENVRRLTVLINDEDGILKCGEFGACVWEMEARRAAITDVLKVHEYSYVEKMSQLCLSIPDHPYAIASLDPDTTISRWSFEASLRAAGAVCEAVDKVMAGDHRNAFCAIRPPGHHAGPRGIVTCPNDPDGSHGFCLLNNVAIGACYARSMYRNDGIKKIAIIDFDVHHGNGTEEIIRNLVPTIETSTVRTPFAVGQLQTPKYRPWLDERDIQDVFFASTHGYGPRDMRREELLGPNQGGWFYPASGKSLTTTSVGESEPQQPLQDFLLTQTWARMGEEARTNCCKIINVGLSLPRHHETPGLQRVDLRDSYRKKILPHLMKFNPDIIFISAGFDGHKKDNMNFGYVGMIEDDYEWVTEQLVKVANACCGGRIVSVLEGGYKIHGGIVSPFARSVASHVRALVEGGCNREPYSEKEGLWESQFERQMIEEKERRRQLRISKDQQVDHDRRRVKQSATATPPAAITRDGDAILKEDEHGYTEQPQEEEEHEGTEDSSRKRRRSQVDYKQLYEQMKKEKLAG